MRTPSLGFLAILAAGPIAAQVAEPPTREEADQLRIRIAAGIRLGFEPTSLRIVPPREGWALGMVSWIAAGKDGVTYLLHRGKEVAPIVAIDREGRVLRSWGEGLFVMPHGIRVAPSRRL